MNHRNPAIKRILADVKELRNHPSSRYHALPLENDMFEWHFTIRGPEDTPFSGGIYHGRILLPAEYPFKPPNIVFLTKNGRFEVGTKICLSISAYHEETWQPAWGVRTMLEALISFLPTEGAGAIGALDRTAEERKKLALESQKFHCPLCGEIASLLSAPTEEEEKPDPAVQEQISQLRMTRQVSDSDRYRAGSLISDVGASDNEFSSVAASLDSSSAAMVSVIALDSEALGRVVESLEGDRDIGSTLEQFVEMEIDSRSALPNEEDRAIHSQPFIREKAIEKAATETTITEDDVTAADVKSHESPEKEPTFSKPNEADAFESVGDPLQEKQHRANEPSAPALPVPTNMTGPLRRMRAAQAAPIQQNNAINEDARIMRDREFVDNIIDYLIVVVQRFIFIALLRVLIRIIISFSTKMVMTARTLG